MHGPVFRVPPWQSWGPTTGSVTSLCPARPAASERYGRGDFSGAAGRVEDENGFLQHHSAHLFASRHHGGPERAQGLGPEVTKSQDLTPSPGLLWTAPPRTAPRAAWGPENRALGLAAGAAAPRPTDAEVLLQEDPPETCSLGPFPPRHPQTAVTCRCRPAQRGPGCEEPSVGPVWGEALRPTRHPEMA